MVIEIISCLILTFDSEERDINVFENTIFEFTHGGESLNKLILKYILFGDVDTFDQTIALYTNYNLATLFTLVEREDRITYFNAFIIRRIIHKVCDLFIIGSNF